MKAIGIVTTTRAEFDLLHPVAVEVKNHPELNLFFIVTGTHLSQSHGYTISKINESGLDGQRRSTGKSWKESIQQLKGSDKMQIYFLLSELGALISEPERQWKLCPTASTIFWIKAIEKHHS